MNPAPVIPLPIILLFAIFTLALWLLTSRISLRDAKVVIRNLGQVIESLRVDNEEKAEALMLLQSTLNTLAVERDRLKEIVEEVEAELFDLKTELKSKGIAAQIVRRLRTLFDRK